MDNSKEEDTGMTNGGTEEVDDGAAAAVDHDLEDSPIIIREGDNVAAAADAADEAVTEDGNSKQKRKIMKVAVDAPWSARMWEGAFVPSYATLLLLAVVAG
jgi:hypothetical protein